MLTEGKKDETGIRTKYTPHKSLRLATQETMASKSSA
jgi:hypothetical protein